MSATVIVAGTYRVTGRSMGYETVACTLQLVRGAWVVVKAPQLGMS